MTLKDGYPHLEALGSITDTTRKLLSHYDMVGNAWGESGVKPTCSSPAVFPPITGEMTRREI
jgi:hypothetical protein